jgi:hypothetical protein
MHTLIRPLIPAFILITACDAVDDSPEAAPVTVDDRAQELAEQAGLAPEELSARRPADDGAAGEGVSEAALDDITLRDPSEQQGPFCEPYDFQSCRETCGIFGEYCFVCQIADDGFPVFYCHPKGTIKS